MSRLRPATTAFGLVLLLCGAAAHAASPSGSPLDRLIARERRPWLPWYNPKTDWNFQHAHAAARQVCRRSEPLPIPRSDLPTVSDLPALASCNSEALYYGFTGKRDFARARQCAYLERALGDRHPISGSAVLSMIYANGLGVRRNVPLATKFACEVGGAPAEINARISHLQRLASANRPQRARFGFCDDITSGYMTGVCAGVAEVIYEVRRKQAIERIASHDTPAQRASFIALQYVARTYFNVHSGEEVDTSGSAGRAFQIGDVVHNEKKFLADVEALEAGKVPVGAAPQSEARLENIYHRVLANPELRPTSRDPLMPNVPMTEMGTITREGIRVDQALWLSYRDAWVHFAAAVRPGVSRDAVRRWITDQRIDDLRCLLPFHDKDFRGCDIPILSPSRALAH